jgi:predicted regulator of Ras-like GTPase activity (Roadblock/LC7/MglB family)
MDQADWRRGPGFDGGLSWLLDDLVTRVAEVDKAVILSRDGLALAASAALTREDAEHLAATAAGFQSLARGIGHHFGGGAVRQTMLVKRVGQHLPVNHRPVPAGGAAE